MSGGQISEAKGAISQSEAAYVRASVAADVRSDGRARLRFRPCVLETGLLPQANGSARLRLGDTDVLVSVKLEIGEPLLSAPDCGRLSVSVECCPSASPEFEGRGAAVVQAELARAMERLLLSGGGGARRSAGHSTVGAAAAAVAAAAAAAVAAGSGSALDLRQLCVVHGEQVWVVYVDAMVMDSDGNLFDALSLCIRAALFQTRIPAIKVFPTALGTMEVELDDDPLACTRISVENMPVFVSLARIGAHFVVDTSIEEELVMDVRLLVGVNKQGDFFTLEKGGFAGLEPTSVFRLLSIAKQIGRDLIVEQDKALLNEEKKVEREPHLDKLGFFSA
eukprot:CAMPEP_0177684504 /NCGR_PEP_ID=MMETSP0447-20121125/32476_1 /TAXON_ID=0 /ORGANISM="Stygamoeba regulata, Strain BSH-02190019" /LENGTH=335 /DNA_ID=CAMNT_0019194375 /DNA_START=57 /DNA_END=1064 /DNA_ORIENTATION=+